MVPLSHFESFTVATMNWLTVMEYLCHKWPRICSICRPFPHSWLITGFVTRLTWHVSLEEQELLTLPKNLSSPPVFSGVRVTRSLVLYVCFVDRCLSFCTFSLAIVFPVLLRYTDSDYPFGIFKLFWLISVFSARKLEGQLTKTVASCISNLFLKKFKGKKSDTCSSLNRWSGHFHQRKGYFQHSRGNIFPNSLAEDWKRNKIQKENV